MATVTQYPALSPLLCSGQGIYGTRADIQFTGLAEKSVQGQEYMFFRYFDCQAHSG
jgi:hypothetical protein